MIDSRKLTNMITLLGAESTDVRKQVREELGRYVPEIRQILRADGQEFSPEVLYELHDLVRLDLHEKLRRGWLNWTGYPNEVKRLEAAFAYLARIDPVYANNDLGMRLQELADAFTEASLPVDIRGLNRYLFQQGRLRGATENYHHPRHSNLCYVLEKGEGLPISLVAIFMLCGARLGLRIHGVNMPGHFLARAVVDGEELLFDPFNQGRILTRREVYLLSLAPRIDVAELLKQPPTAQDIIMRVLVNLINAYYRSGAIDEYHLCGTLLADLRSGGPDGAIRRLEPQRARPVFGRGQLVRHKRYGYRGVVVDFDMRCEASDDWYFANRTQPKKDQPWYHVLVGGSDVSTYAAESNLGPDVSGREIQHPLIPMYFEKFSNGRYIRNDVPWHLYE